jgi:hypothetical protein
LYPLPTVERKVIDPAAIGSRKPIYGPGAVRVDDLNAGSDEDPAPDPTGR